ARPRWRTSGRAGGKRRAVRRSRWRSPRAPVRRDPSRRTLHGAGTRCNGSDFARASVLRLPILASSMGMDVKLPNLGEGADSGTVVSVLVKPGASVKKGQNIIELETGKAVAPIPAPADGKIGRIAVKEGDTVSVGQLILVLETGDGETGAGKAPESAAEPAAPRKSAPPPRGRAATRRRPE